jgi:hypothetical protein
MTGANDANYARQQTRSLATASAEPPRIFTGCLLRLRALLVLCDIRYSLEHATLYCFYFGSYFYCYLMDDEDALQEEVDVVCFCIILIPVLHSTLGKKEVIGKMLGC